MPVQQDSPVLWPEETQHSSPAALHPTQSTKGNASQTSESSGTSEVSGVSHSQNPISVHSASANDSQAAAERAPSGPSHITLPLNPRDMLFTACTRNDLSTLDSGLSKMDAAQASSLRDIEGRSLLDAAMEAAHPAVVERLFQAGVQIDLDNNDLDDVLLRASVSDTAEIIEAVLTHLPAGALTPGILFNPLNHASEAGHLGHVRAYLTACPDTALEQPMIAASENGHGELITLLLQFKASPDGYGSGNMFSAPICGALSKGHESVARQLLAAGAHVDYNSDAVLNAATVGGCVEFLKETLSRGSFSADALNEALRRGCTGRSVEAVQTLLAHAEAAGIATDFPAMLRNPDTKSFYEDFVGFINFDGRPMFSPPKEMITFIEEVAGTDKDTELLGSAVTSGALDLLSKLLARGPAPARVSAVLESASDPAVVRMLLDAKANPNAIGRCSLGRVASLFSTESVKMLLDAGAKVKPVGSEMPLFQTIMTPCSKDKAKDKVAIVQLLLDAGAPIRGSYEGKKTSALHLCGQVVHGNDGAVDAAVAQVAALLLARDPQLLELKDSQGRTPLLAVAASHNVKVAEVLVQSGADVTVCDSINKPLVHCALAAHRDLSPYRYFPKDRRTVLRMLLEAGADPIPCDKFGRTVLMTLVSPLRLQFSVPDLVAAFFIGDVADAILARG